MKNRVSLLLLFSMLVVLCFRASAQNLSKDVAPAVPDTEVTVPGDDGQNESFSAAGELRPFSAVISVNWKLWSGGRDSISRDDLIALFVDPAIKGEDAAALAALVRHLRHNGGEPVSLLSVSGITDKNTLSFYSESAAKLKSVKRVLFASGRPDFSKLRQGPATDCYFFSGTGWIAKFRPEVITGAIKEIPGKGFRVVFPDGEEALVSPPTDAEMAYNDSPSTLGDGIWMPVLLKAEGVIEGRRNARRAEIADPSLRVDVGGGPAAIVKRWTGNGFSGFNLGGASRKAVRAALVRMQGRGLMAEALSYKHPDGKLIGNHCYAILAFDAETDILTVWNPWGNDFTPKGPSGPEFGFERRGGVFKISLDDFMKLFRYLAIEKP